LQSAELLLLVSTRQTSTFFKYYISLAYWGQKIILNIFGKSLSNNIQAPKYQKSLETSKKIVNIL